MIEEFKIALQAGRMHHAWMIYGHRVYDKVALIWKLIEEWLSENNYTPAASKQVIRKMQQGSHPDFYMLTIAEGAKFISVEQVRAATKFLKTTTVELPYRILIIDSLDDLNNNAANALLKSLEEPPANTIIFLTCHVLGQVLPTIRSRCRILRVHPKLTSDFLAKISHHYPTLAMHEQEILAEISQGAWEMVVQIMDDALLPVCVHLANIFASKTGRDAEVLSLAQKAKREDKVWDLLQYIIPYFMQKKIKEDPKAANVLQKLDFLETAENLLADARKLHLDRGQVIIAVLS